MRQVSIACELYVAGIAYAAHFCFIKLRQQQCRFSENQTCGTLNVMEGTMVSLALISSRSGGSQMCSKPSRKANRIMHFIKLSRYFIKQIAGANWHIRKTENIIEHSARSARQIYFI